MPGGALLGVGPETVIHDVGNACLGVLTGMVEIANRIELGQVRAGMVVSCETASEINEIVIDQMLENPSMDFFKRSLATLTGGSGAVAVLAHRRLGFGIEGPQATGRGRPVGSRASRALPLGHRGNPSRAIPGSSISSRRPTRRRCSPMASSWARQTWRDFSRRLGWLDGQVDKVICHQVGSIAPRDDPQLAGDSRVQRFFHIPLPGKHGHRLASADGGPGRRPSLLAARRPGGVSGDRQRAQLHDARCGMVIREYGVTTALNQILDQLPDRPPRPRLRSRRAQAALYRRRVAASRSSCSTATPPGHSITGT